MSVQLAQALHDRDEARKHAPSEERLQSADFEVTRVKALISDRLDEIAMELDGLRRELSAEEARYKTGEYTEFQYRNATADTRHRIASLDRLESSFNALLEAEVEADLRRTSRPPATPVHVARPAPVISVAREEAAPLHEVAAKARGWKGIPAPRWMLLGSGVLIAVGVIAVAILLLQTAFGSFSMPSLFERGADTDSTLSTPPTGTAPPVVAPASSQFQVPVQIHDAQGVGSLYIEVAYDQTDIEVVQLDPAALPANTLMENSVTPGRVVIGVATSTGLSGDWTLAFITCRRAPGAATSGDSVLTISSVEANLAADLSEAATMSSAGRVNLSSLSVVPPVITFE